MREPSSPPFINRAHRATKRYLYAWGDGHADGDGSMCDLLGGKGANLAEMTSIGSAGSSGFHDHDRSLRPLLQERPQVAGWSDGRSAKNVGMLEKELGKKFGDNANPLLVSVRSGAAFRCRA